MSHKTLKGIALILFGVLLYVSGDEMNGILFSNSIDFPFTLLSVMVGVAGLIIVVMDHKSLRGIAFIVSGIFLHFIGDEMNSFLFSNSIDFPFTLFGVIIGVVGLIIIFVEGKRKKEK